MIVPCDSKFGSAGEERYYSSGEPEAGRGISGELSRRLETGERSHIHGTYPSTMYIVVLSTYPYISEINNPLVLTVTLLQDFLSAGGYPPFTLHLSLGTKRCVLTSTVPPSSFHAATLLTLAAVSGLAGPRSL